MWKLDHKETWAPKNWCFWTVVLEKTPESPLDYKEIKLVNPKGNQPWIFIGRTEAKAETPIFWPPKAKNWLIGKDPGAGKDWRQEEKGVAEDDMVGWHHCLDGHAFEQALRDSDGQESLACCSPWCCKESDTTERLYWNETGSSDSKESSCDAEDKVLSLGQEDPLEEGMATHSSILAWRIPWIEEPRGRKAWDMIEQLTFALDSKYFRLCKPHCLCHCKLLISDLVQWKLQWMWLCSSKTFLYALESKFHIIVRCHKVFSLWFFFSHLKMQKLF